MVASDSLSMAGNATGSVGISNWVDAGNFVICPSESSGIIFSENYLTEPAKETNLMWLNRRVKEICDCWKENV